MARNSSAGHWRTDILRAVLACMGLAGLFGIAVFMGTGSAPVTRTASSPVAQGDDDLTTGSIVFVPILGDRCRKRLIDNTTWRIRDGGEVDCSSALSESAGHARWSNARVDVIRRSFRNQ